MSDGPESDSADSPFRRTVMICNRRGLHARAAARFVKLVDQFDRLPWQHLMFFERDDK